MAVILGFRLLSWDWFGQVAGQITAELVLFHDLFNNGFLFGCYFLEFKPDIEVLRADILLTPRHTHRDGDALHFDIW